MGLIQFSRELWQQPSSPAEPAKDGLAAGAKVLIARQGGALFESVSGRGANTHVGLQATPLGSAALFNNTQATFEHAPSHDVLGAITIVVIARVDALTNYGALISKGIGTTTTLPYELRVGAAATDSRIEFVRANAGGYRAWDSSNTTNAFSAGNALQFIAVTQGSGIQTTPVFYINDTVRASPFAAGGTGTGDATSGGGNLYLGKRADSVTYLNGAILFAGIWDHAKSARELCRIRDNCWQLFEPRRIVVPVVTAGATFKSAWARGANTVISAGARP